MARENQKQKIKSYKVGELEGKSKAHRGEAKKRLLRWEAVKRHSKTVTAEWKLWIVWRLEIGGDRWMTGIGRTEIMTRSEPRWEVER